MVTYNQGQFGLVLVTLHLSRGYWWVILKKHLWRKEWSCLWSATAHQLPSKGTEEEPVGKWHWPLLDKGDRKASCICGPWDEAVSTSWWVGPMLLSQLWLRWTLEMPGSISRFKKGSAGWDFSSCSPTATQVRKQKKIGIQDAHTAVSNSVLSASPPNPNTRSSRLTAVLYYFIYL